MEWLEQLQKIREKMIDEDPKDEDNKENSFMNTLEDTNADLSKNTKRFKESNRYIFKQNLSYQSAKELMEFADKFKNTESLSMEQYKTQLHKICSLIACKGESPVEMLVYSTKKYEGNRDFKNIIMDELKEMYIIDNNLEEAYKNILTNWNWTEQVLLVIQSIKQIKLKCFGEELMNIFEKNVYLREKAASALIYLGHQEYYDSIINLMLAIKDDSKDTSNMMYRIFSSMSNYSSSAVQQIFKVYMEKGFNRALNNMFVGVIRKNANSAILEQIEIYCNSNNMGIQRKALMLLAKINNGNARTLLNDLKKNGNVNLKLLLIALGYTKDDGNSDFFKCVIGDDSKSVDERTTAIISLATTGNKQHKEYIEQFLNKSPEFEIASASALVELGELGQIKNIFRYILDTNVEDEHLRSAIVQINRLRGLRIASINNSLLAVFKALLEQKNENLVMRTIDVITNYTLDEEVGKMLISKLDNADTPKVKISILDYLSKNFCMLGDELKGNLRNTVVECSKSNSIKVREKAMDSLKIIAKQDDLSPVINNKMVGGNYA